MRLAYFLPSVILPGGQAFKESAESQQAPNSVPAEHLTHSGRRDSLLEEVILNWNTKYKKELALKEMRKKLVGAGGTFHWLKLPSM